MNRFKSFGTFLFFLILMFCTVSGVSKIKWQLEVGVGMGFTLSDFNQITENNFTFPSFEVGCSFAPFKEPFRIGAGLQYHLYGFDRRKNGVTYENEKIKDSYDIFGINLYIRWQPEIKSLITSYFEVFGGIGEISAESRVFGRGFESEDDDPVYEKEYCRDTGTSFGAKTGLLILLNRLGFRHNRAPVFVNISIQYYHLAEVKYLKPGAIEEFDSQGSSGLPGYHFSGVDMIFINLGLSIGL